MRDTVTELLDSGCTVQVEATPHISSPLSVVTNERGKFKYEDLRVAMLLIEKNNFFVLL